MDPKDLATYQQDPLEQEFQQYNTQPQQQHLQQQRGRIQSHSSRTSRIFPVSGAPYLGSAASLRIHPNDGHTNSTSPSYGESTSQPLWSLYNAGTSPPPPPAQLDTVSGLQQIHRIPSQNSGGIVSGDQLLNPQISDHSLGEQNSTSMMGTNQFLPFAGETEQQKRNLMMRNGAFHGQQQHEQRRGRTDKINFDHGPNPSSTSSFNEYDPNPVMTLAPAAQPLQALQMAPRAQHLKSLQHQQQQPYQQPHQQLQQPQPQHLQRHPASSSFHHLSRALPSREQRMGSYCPPHPVMEEIDDEESESEVPLTQLRSKYKPKSSIPPDLSSSNYAEQCAAAAVSSRLPPYQLHIDEHNLLRSHLAQCHVTTYLNIRNGILRLWLSNPMVNVTRAEAAGCAREERYYGLAEVAYEWLLRNGYINFGCIEHPFMENIFDFHTEERKKPRMTIVIVGAGIAGLGCARQLDSLLRKYASRFTEYEDLPRVVVLEGRRRIGGRIYSAPLKSDHNYMVELGASAIMGFGNGNPLAVVVRRQLGLPVVPIDPPVDYFDAFTKVRHSDLEQRRVKGLFNHVMSKVSHFQKSMPKPFTAEGDEVLMRAGRDPSFVRDDLQEYQTIAKVEESGEYVKPYDDPGTIDDESQNPEAADEINLLKNLGFDCKHETPKGHIHIAPEPAGDMYPSLGQTIDGIVKQLAGMAEITPKDIRLLNWYYANLEFAQGDCLDEISLSSWDQEEGSRLSGRHSMIKNGFSSLVRALYTYPEKLDVRFKTTVKVIEYGEDDCQIFLENGERIQADRLIVTVPLGILKDRAIQFIPDIPQWKTDSIKRLGFGVTNKVAMIFDAVFWDDSKDVFCVSQQGNGENGLEGIRNTRGAFYMFMNCSKTVGKPCLVALVAGEAAISIANESDENLIARVKDCLSWLFPDSKSVQLVESVATRWQIDPFSRGAYSYVGLEATAADFDLLARPIGKSLFFAGEATSRTYPATVHGAYLSGLRASSEVMDSLIGEIDIPFPLVPPKDSARFHRYQKAHYGVSSARSHSIGPSPATVHSSESELLDESTGGIKRRQSNSGTIREITAIEAKLRELKDKRIADDNERMRNDLIRELGERPVKPERCGANPFLIFQKDFWDICRKETDLEKQNASGNATAKATRNEVRAALGKMWRELPEEKKNPYRVMTKNIKETNDKNSAEFRRKLKQYDSEAEDFRRRWKEENASKPSAEEQALAKLIQDAGDSKAKRPRRM